MKKLHLTFLNSEGKKHKMIPRIANENLSAQTVRQVMEEISGLPLFVKKMSHSLRHLLVQNMSKPLKQSFLLKKFKTDE